jgi:foldase protein PrsA
MRYLKPTLLLATSAAVLAGCGGNSSVPSSAVATCGNQTITNEQYNSLIDQAKRSYKVQKRAFPKAGSTEYETLKNQAVGYLVQRCEFADEANTLGIKITDKQVADRLAQIKKQYFSNSETKYKAQLKTQGLSEQQVTDDIKAQLVSELIFKKVTSNVKVDDPAVKKYYDSHLSQYGTPEQRDIAHILVKKKPLADSLYAQIKAGADFGTLAKKYSQDPGSKAQGGKLTISKGQTVAPFDAMAFVLKTGAVSRPVKTEFGYHIIKALGPIKPAKTTPFKQVKESIRQQLLQQQKNTAMTTWVNKVKKDFAGKVHYQAGYAPPTTTSGATPTTTT